MTEVLTVDEMSANVELSRVHIVKQNAVIARLTEQNHHKMADDALRTLDVMNKHLTLEIEMLERLKDAATKSEQTS